MSNLLLELFTLCLLQLLHILFRAHVHTRNRLLLLFDRSLVLRFLFLHLLFFFDSAFLLIGEKDFLNEINVVSFPQYSNISCILNCLVDLLLKFHKSFLIFFTRRFLRVDSRMPTPLHLLPQVLGHVGPSQNGLPRQVGRSYLHALQQATQVHYGDSQGTVVLWSAGHCRGCVVGRAHGGCHLLGKNSGGSGEQQLETCGELLR